MAEAGATDPQIAAVSGHSIEETRKILDTYIPRRSAIAAAAIAAWEKLDETQGGGHLHQLAEAGKELLETRDRERALRLARAGVPLASIADAFSWSLEQVQQAVAGGVD